MSLFSDQSDFQSIIQSVQIMSQQNDQKPQNTHFQLDDHSESDIVSQSVNWSFIQSVSQEW